MSLARDLARSLDPAMVMRDAGFEPDGWQEKAIRSDAKRKLLCCSRQSGKSETAAARALHLALYEPGALILLISPSQRQSGELFLKLSNMYGDLDDVVEAEAETVLRLELRNRSRIVSLPPVPRTIRCYSAPRAIFVDEAAHTDDALLHVILPMLAVSDGELLALSTPNGRRGWFYEAWHHDDSWEKTRITWEDCPRISKESVELYRRLAGELMYRQEFCTEFLDSAESVFPTEIIERAFSSQFEGWRI